MARLKHIAQQRLDKLEKFRGLGLNPYPRSYHRSHAIQESLQLFQQSESDPAQTLPSEFRLAGRVTAIRFIGKVGFFDIRDGSGKIQVFFSRDILGDDNYQLLHEIDIGDIIGVAGKVFRTRAGEISIEAKEFNILAKSLQPLPEKWHGLVDVEKRYRQRYLDLISNEEIKTLFLIRSRVISSFRLFLDNRGFIEVETPVLQPVAGGALARRFKTHHQALGLDLYLRIALELYLKRLIIGGLDKVYEIGRVFRNEGISTRHNPEFTMAEIYEAYADYEDMMAMLEEMVSFIAQKVTGKTSVKFGEETINLEPPWPRIRLREAIKERCGIDFEDYPDVDSLRGRMKQLGQDVDPKKDRGRLIDELISTYVEPHLMQPTFLVDYPLDMSPLAKRKDNSKTIVERFETFIGGMEIANAFTELNDPLEQRERFLKQKHIQSAESVKSKASDEGEVDIIDEDFLLAMEYGMPPTGGLGVGIDRLAMLFTGKQSIREVILFPQLKTK